MAENSDTQIVRTFQVSQTQTVVSLFPLASEIAGYEQVLPGSADRILTMVEKECEHRRALEKRAMELEGRDSLISIVVSCIIIIFVIKTENSDSITRKSLRNRLRDRLPFKLQKIFSEKMIDDVLVWSFDEWNEKFSQFPLSRLDPQLKS